MTLAYLRFNLEKEEDQDDHKLANNARNMWLALWDIEQELRKCYKYGHEFKDADDAVDKIRDKFYEILDDYNLDLTEM